MVILTLRIHPSIRTKEVPKDYSKDFEPPVSIQSAISEMMNEYPKMNEIIIEDGKIKPGLLVFADKTELTSMGLLENQLEEDLQIRIVPILHGG